MKYYMRFTSFNTTPRDHRQNDWIASAVDDGIENRCIYFKFSHFYPDFVIQIAIYFLLFFILLTKYALPVHNTQFQYSTKN